MKTKYLIPVLLLLPLAGCDKEKSPTPSPSNNPQGARFVFTSSIGENSKVTLNPDNTLFWAAGDQISVYDYRAGSSVLICSDDAALVSGEGSGIGSFAPKTHPLDNAWYEDIDAGTQVYDFYAYYPGPAVTPVSKVVDVEVSALQRQILGFGSYVVSHATTTSTKNVLAGGVAPNFSFSPKSALLKLSLRNEAEIPVKISSIEIGATSANIAGNASLNLATGELSAGDEDRITYIPQNAIEIPAGGVASAPIYISVLPCAPEALTVTLNYAGFKYNESVVALETIESGHVYSKEAVISTFSRELDIPNDNTTNLATASALDALDHYYGMANCVVMGYNDTQCTLNITLKKSNGSFARSGVTPTLQTAVNKAKVIWAEEMLYNDPNFCISSGDVNRLIINKSAGFTGNALIGIYRDEELLWSYHVWCPVDDAIVKATSEDGSPVTYDAYKLILGQILGPNNDTYMYYQWGRKDPLGRAKSDFSASELIRVFGDSYPSVENAIDRTTSGPASNNVSYARKNPTTFITGAGVLPHDWYPQGGTSAQNSTLWNSSNATFNDPCPQGFRVAPKELFAGPGGSTKPEGDLFQSAGLWYVAGSYRNFANGFLSTLGTHGCYWASEVVANSVNAYDLTYNSGTFLNRVDESYRAFAWGVRCVR